MKWSGNDRTHFAPNGAPINSGAAGTGYGCYNGGTWEIVQDPDTSYIYHVTVTGYEFDPDFVFPQQSYALNNIGKSYTGYFSAGYIEAVSKYPDDTPATTFYMDAKVSNIRYTSISDVVIESEGDAYNPDNIATYTFQSSSEGNYSKIILFAGTSYTGSNGNGDGRTILGRTDETFYTRFTVDSRNDEEDWAYGVDILIKFDNNLFILKKAGGGKEYTTNNTQDYQLEYNILYAAKPDGTGWASEEEMNQTSMDDLVYYDTLEAINESGDVCVAWLAESTSGYAKSGEEPVVRVPLGEFTKHYTI